MKTKRTGFTMVEMLAVVMIIALLATLLIGYAGFANKQSKIAATTLEVQKLANAIEIFRQDFGTYPTSTPVRVSAVAGSAYVGHTNAALLYAQLTQQGWTYYQFATNRLRHSFVIYGFWSPVPPGAWSNVTFHLPYPAPLDPWEKFYGYYCTYPATTNQVNAGSFDLWSFGPDGQTGNADDIRSWQ